MKYKERKYYNKVITIKLVIPGSCNANCSFCYMKDYKSIMKQDKEEFLNNYLTSLLYIIEKIGESNPISLDITGNEPTMDVTLLKRVLTDLKKINIKEKLSRITITTNGYHLKELIEYFEGIIDYVNISIHDYRVENRKDIMKYTLYDEDYKNLVSDLKKINITSSAISVIHKPILDFSNWRDNFIEWCKDKGFISLRFRCNVFWNNTELFDQYMDETIKNKDFSVLVHENTPDSHWCRLRRYDKFRVFFLHGVLDTSINTKGIEYVIADDGYCYCDFYKRTKIEDYKFEIGKIYDIIK